MSADLVKGNVELLVLSVLEAGPAHGYAIIEQLRARSAGVFDLPEGTVYPALHRLELAGLLTSGWDSAAGRRRRVYELSSAGRLALAERRREWQTFSAGVRAIVEAAS